jgi:hypothetical protein
MRTINSNKREQTAGSGTLSETASKTKLFVTAKVVRDSTVGVDNGHPSPTRGGTSGLRKSNCSQIRETNTVICFRDEVSDVRSSVNSRKVVSF